MADPLAEQIFDIGGVTIRALVAGDHSAPTVILLHGFPETSRAWLKQIPLLVKAGFRVVVPDGRGYGGSSKPQEVSAYAIPLLEADVLGVVDQSGAQQVCVAGHDWGAIIAWFLAMRHPDRIRRLAILNVPHPAVARTYLRSRPAQMIRSWYAFLFQLPAVPEMLLRANDYAVLQSTMRRSSCAGTFTDEELQEYKRAWSVPGALTGMLNWYRAGLRYMPPAHELKKRVTVPTRIIWGMKDAFLLPGMAEDSRRYCDHADLISLPEATHWLHHEQPERVAGLLADWFRCQSWANGP